jgi:stage II sporulation protein D
MLSILTAITFIIALSIFIAGIGNFDGIIKNSKASIKKFSLDGNDILTIKDKENVKIMVYKTSEDTIVEMPLEEYVRGVVAAEMPAEFPIEALKAQAIAARTYVLAKHEEYGGSKCSIGKGADICDTVHCQAFQTKDERFINWSQKSAADYWDKITQAVAETASEVLSYEGELVMGPYYFSTSSGRTENAGEVMASALPYLVSVSSPGEEASTKYRTSIQYKYTDLAKEINSKYPQAKVSSSKLKSQIKVLERTSGAGSVKLLKIGSINITGKEFRTLLGLPSTNFQVKFDSKYVTIECKGYGHGVGMSQWGAASMAREGSKYADILTHYYQGTKVQELGAIK